MFTMVCIESPLQFCVGGAYKFLQPTEERAQSSKSQGEARPLLLEFVVKLHPGCRLSLAQLHHSSPALAGECHMKREGRVAAHKTLHCVLVQTAEVCQLILPTV